MSFQTVLLIEDDKHYAQVVRNYLSRTSVKFEIIWEESLKAAIERNDFDRIDVILCDLSLPDSNGIDTIIRLRSKVSDKPVVVLTANDDQELSIELLKNGAQDYVVKGKATIDTLDRSIRHSIQRQQNILETQELLRQVEENRDLLERKNSKLAKLYSQAHEFVDNVSHEFRTPLTVIKAYISLVRDGLAGEVNDEQARLLTIVEDRADDLNIMVDDMLDVSKLEAGMLGTWRKNSSIEDIFEHVKDSLERKAAIKNITIDWSLEDNLPSVYCDAEKVTRVITNIAINALKFCGEPGHVTITASANDSNDEIQIAIRDNGPGIDPALLASIFRRFRQLGPQGRGSTKGFGLGLNIAKELVELNFGRLDVASEVGNGSTFSFTVPMAIPRMVAERYLNRIGALEPSITSISIVEAGIENQVDGTLAGDADEFLNSCLRKDDLLFRFDSKHWVILLPESTQTLNRYFERISKEWNEANRNRPFGALPRIQMRTIGTWSRSTESDLILGEIEQLSPDQPLCSAEMNEPTFS